MKKYGGFIPGIRAGRPTAEYLDYVLTRVTLPGSIYLGLIALDPADRARAGRREPELPVRRRVDPDHRRCRPRDGQADRLAAAAASLRRAAPMTSVARSRAPSAADRPSRRRQGHAGGAARRDPTASRPISTGDIFRDERRRTSTELGMQVKAIVDAGAYVPDSLTNDLVRDRLPAGRRRGGLPARRLPAHDRAGRRARPHPRRGRHRARRRRAARRRRRRGRRSAAQARARAGSQRRHRRGHPSPPRGLRRADGAADRRLRRPRARRRRRRPRARSTRSPSASSPPSRHRVSRLIDDRRPPDAVGFRHPLQDAGRAAARWSRPGLVTAASLDAVARRHPPGHHDARARRDRRSGDPSRAAGARTSSSFRATGTRSAPRSTTTSCTASRATACCSRATSCRSTAAPRSTAGTATRRSRVVLPDASRPDEVAAAASDSPT